MVSEISQSPCPAEGKAVAATASTENGNENDAEYRSKTTLFVRNLPYTATKDDLESFFGEVGPIRMASVICDNGRSRGFGFVKYSLAEDAKEALKTLRGKQIGDRRVRLEMASKKGMKPKEALEKDKKKYGKQLADTRNENQEPGVAESKDSVSENSVQDSAKKANSLLPQKRKEKRTPQKKNDVSDRTVVVSGLANKTTDKHIYKRARKQGKVAKVTLVDAADNISKVGIAEIEYASFSDAEKGLKSLDKHTFKGATISACMLRDLRQNRLIVRNAPFVVLVEDVRKFTHECGPIQEIHIPNTKDQKTGKSRGRGFFFIQFYRHEDAIEAMKATNGKKLKGRVVAVDLATSKAPSSDCDSQDQTTGLAEDAPVADAEDRAEFGEEEEDRSDGATDEEDDMSDQEEVESKQAKKENLTDSNEEMERTIFVRNILFETTEETLLEAFRKFGAVQYVRMVMNRDTGLPRGTAFVRFYKPGGAQRAMKAGAGTSKAGSGVQSGEAGKLYEGIVVDGRKLDLTWAMNKDDAMKITTKTKKPTDKRNLYLLQEGYVDVNETKEKDIGLPASDIEKRKRAHKEKKEKLKNPLFFVSPVRLSVRNLAKHVDDGMLKKLFQESAKAGLKENLVSVGELRSDHQPEDSNADHPLKVVSAKVVRDMEEKGADGKFRSRGFAFVEFSQHLHAMAALRKINNNPQFGDFAPNGAKAMSKPAKDRARLIVEFAVENKKKIKIRETRLEALKKKREEEKGLKADAAEQEEVSKKRKNGRGSRQREAKRLKCSETTEEESELSKVKGEGKETIFKTKVTTAAREVKVSKSTKRPREHASKSLALISNLEEGSIAERGRDKAKKRTKNSKKRLPKEELHFEKMVASYKTKMFGGADEKASRWFD